jgi:hypothetical protein
MMSPLARNSVRISGAAACQPPLAGVRTNFPEPHHAARSTATSRSASTPFRRTFTVQSTRRASRRSADRGCRRRPPTRPTEAPDRTGPTANPGCVTPERPSLERRAGLPDHARPPPEVGITPRASRDPALLRCSILRALRRRANGGPERAFLVPGAGSGGRVVRTETGPGLALRRREGVRPLGPREGPTRRERFRA